MQRVCTYDEGLGIFGRPVPRSSAFRCLKLNDHNACRSWPLTLECLNGTPPNDIASTVLSDRRLSERPIFVCKCVIQELDVRDYICWHYFHFFLVGKSPNFDLMGSFSGRLTFNDVAANAQRR
jgi:hypothetical protein